MMKAQAYTSRKTRARLLRKVTVMGAVCVGIATGFTNTATAESAGAYPSRPIKLVLPLAPGGGTDIVARALAKEMESSLGQTIYIENRPGANGAIGTQQVARAEPDGYTISVGTTGTHVVNEFLYPGTLSYSPARDFDPITPIAIYNNVVVVAAGSPYKTFADFVKDAKARPGELFYATSQVGNSAHLATEMFKSVADISMSAVNYGGSSPAIVDILGGRIDVMFDSILSHQANISAGKERALATTASERSSALPDVPTISELGYPGYEAVGWVGLFAPAGTPLPIRQKIAEAVKKAYATSNLRENLGSRGVELISMTPERYEEYLQAERKKWSTVIKEADIKVQR